MARRMDEKASRTFCFYGNEEIEEEGRLGNANEGLYFA
ncbi:hypothetical protein PASE110613_18015 [Paenibacillus sediminis]